MEFSGLISTIYPSENKKVKFILTNIWSNKNYGVIENKICVDIPSNVINDLKVNTCITIKGIYDHNSNKLPCLTIPGTLIDPKSNSSDTGSKFKPAVSYWVRYLNKVYTF
jgi:hypothetical protein